jgi:ubiquitin C
MQIFLRGKTTYVIDVEKTDTIRHIKDRIYEKEGIPARFLILQCKLRCLEEAKTLEEYGVRAEDTIEFRVRAVALSDTSDLSENAPLRA